MFTSSEHCPPEDLQGYLAGDLNEHQADAIERHLETCQACAETCNSLDTSEDAVVAALHQPPPGNPFAKEPEYQGLLEKLRARGQAAAKTGHGTRPAHERGLGRIGGYRLIDCLGAGGMGTVFHAVHEMLGRDVAVKILHRDRGSDPAAISRFRREIEALGKIGDEEHIVRPEYAGEQDGAPFLVMELVDGLNLSQVMKRQGSLAVADACELIRQASLGLQHAHAHDVVHRDIKPSNLMLTPAGSVKILDLGLARFSEEHEGDDELTGSGQVMGTREYMAPEQLLDSRTVDIRADIYSLGRTLYKLLTARAPGHPRTPPPRTARGKAVVGELDLPIQDLPPNVPAGLADVLRRMLARQPQDRYATPAEVVEAMGPFCSGHDLAGLLSRLTQTHVEQAADSPEVSAPPEFPSYANSYWRRKYERKTATKRNTWWVYGGFVAAALLLAGGLFAGYLVSTRTRTGEDGQSITNATWDRGEPRVDASAVPPTVPEHAVPTGAVDAPPIAAIDPPPTGSPRCEFSHADLYEFLVKILIDRYSEQGRRILYTEIASSVDRGYVGTWRIGNGMTRDGQPYEIAVKNQMWFPRQMTQREAAELGIGPGTTQRVVGPVMWTMPVRQLLTIEEAELQVVRDSTGGQRLVGHLRCRLQSPLLVDNLGLVLTTASPDESENVTRNNFQYVTSNRLPSGEFQVFLSLPPEVDLKYGARLSFQAFIYRPAAGYYRISNEFTWAGGAAATAAPVPPTAAPPAVKSPPAGLSFEGVAVGEPLRPLQPATIEIAARPDQRSCGRQALVTDPAELANLRSWTIETKAHRGAVRDLAYHPEEPLLATASTDAVIRLWSSKDGSFVRLLVGHDDAVTSLCWSPDGKWLVSGGGDGTVRYWNTTRGLVRICRGHTGKVHCVAWSPDGRIVASCGADRSVRFWEASSGKMANVRPAHTDEVEVVAFSPSGETLASGGRDKTVRLWNTTTGKVVKTLEGHRGGVRDLAFSPDGKTLASAAATLQVDCGVRFWNVESGSLLSFLPLHAHGDTALAFSPDGKTLALGSGYYDKAIRLWNIESGELLVARPKPSGIHPVECLVFSPDGQQLALTGRGGEVELWEFPSGRSLRVLPAHAGSVHATSFSPDGKLLACGSEDGEARLWKTAPFRCDRRIRSENDTVDTLAFSPDGNTLATSYFSSTTIDLWEVGSGNHVTKLGPAAGPVNCLNWSHDGELLASGGVVAEVWRPADARMVRRLRAKGSSLAWLREGITLAVGAGPDVEIWDIPTNSIQKLIPGNAGTIRSLAWQENEQLLATGTDDGAVCIGDPSSDVSQRIDSDHPSPVCCLGWLKGGSQLATGSFDWVTLLSIELGKSLSTVEGHCGDFSPDRRLVALQGPSIVRLHDLRNGQLLCTLLALREGQWAVINPEGHLSGSPKCADELIYVLQTADGQQLATQADFTAKHHWKNIPDRADIPPVK